MKTELDVLQNILPKSIKEKLLETGDVEWISLCMREYAQQYKDVSVDFNYWVARQGFRFIESKNLYYWRSEKLDMNIKDGNELYKMYENSKTAVAVAP